METNALAQTAKEEIVSVSRKILPRLRVDALVETNALAKIAMEVAAVKTNKKVADAAREKRYNVYIVS